MKLYIVMLGVDYEAPELGYYFVCKSKDEVMTLYKEAGFNEEPTFRQYKSGDYIEDCGGGIEEDSKRPESIRVFEFDMEDFSMEKNLKALGEILRF